MGEEIDHYEDLLYSHLADAVFSFPQSLQCSLAVLPYLEIAITVNSLYASHPWESQPHLKGKFDVV